MKVIIGYVSETDEPFAKLLPIGCGYIHAVISEAGHDSLLVNFSDMSLRQQETIIREQNPGIVFFSQFTHNRQATFNLAQGVKKIAPESFVVLGGPHASFTADDILQCHPEIDAVVVGEGEDTSLELINALESGEAVSGVAGIVYRKEGRVVATSTRNATVDLDRLPFPAVYAMNSKGVNLRRQMEFIITSRGCPSSCTFCSSPTYWGRRIRYCSADSVVREIKYLRDQYGLIYFSIRDDTFTSSKQRVIDFCKKLLAERVFILWNCQSRVNAVDAEVLGWLKRAGCESIQYGVESGSERVLRTLGKAVSIAQAKEAARITREAGIRLSIYLITGVPGEDDSDVKKTLSLVDDLKADDGQVSPLVYFPGTALFQQAVKENVIGKELFSIQEGESFPVRTDSFGELASQRILNRVASVAKCSEMTSADYCKVRKRHGYAHVGNISEGEYHCGRGDFRKARELYQEIVRLEPDNPWGWLMMGELQASLAEYDKAISSFRKLLDLVPQHAPGYAALAELYALIGDRGRSVESLAKVVELDPWDGEAKLALRQAEMKRKKAKH